MTNEKTLITLDFDGVVSPIDHNKNFANDTEYTMIKLAGFDCAIRTKVLEFLKEISENETIDVVWVTTWDSLTKHFHEDSDGKIPDFPFLETRRNKAKTILEHIKKEKYEKAYIFEDSPDVKKEFNKKQRELENKIDTYITFNKCKTEEGIKDSHIKHFKTSVK